MKKFALACAALSLAASMALAEDSGDGIMSNRAPPTEPVLMVTLGPDKTMRASRVKVSEVAGGKPLLCFKDPDKQLVSCFVVNVTTGQVVFVQLPTDETNV